MSPKPYALLALLAACAAPSAARQAAPRTALDAAGLRELEARLERAPRRAPGDPIVVAILPAKVAPELAGAVPGHALASVLARELERDPLLRPTVVDAPPRGSLEEAAYEAIALGTPRPDVWLWLAAMPVAGAHGEPGLALEVETWAGEADGRKGLYRTIGTVPRRALLLADAGEELRHALVWVIGPKLPRHGEREAIRAGLLARPRTDAPARPDAARVDGPAIKRELPERAANPDAWKQDCTTQGI